MTVRPNSHALEDRSRSEFRLLFPSEWVIEDIRHDYGLDMRVEVFMQGRPTGLMFYVQLKATSTMRRGIVVRSRHLDYWASLDVPVFVALWQANSNEMYWQWAHHFHPYVSRAIRRPAQLMVEPATQTISFRASNRWLASDIEQIATELQYLRGPWGSVRLPIELGVTRAEIDTPNAGDFEAMVRQLADEVVGDVSVYPGVISAGRAHLFLGKRHFQLRVGRVQLSVTAPTGLGLFKGEIAPEIATFLGIALCNVGAVVAGARLLDQYSLSSLLLCAAGRHCELLLSAILRSNRYDIAVRLAKLWWDCPDGDGRLDHAPMLTAFLACRMEQLDEAAQTEVETLLRRHWVSPVQGIKDIRRDLASSLVSAGAAAEAVAVYAHLLGDVEPASAAGVPLLREAAVADAAAGQWTRAITKLSQVSRSTGLAEDTLALARAYRDAGRYADGLLALHSIADPRFAGRARLAALTLGILGEQVNWLEQMRFTSEADRLVRTVSPASSSAQLASAFREAIRLDAASPNTWWIHQLLAHQFPDSSECHWAGHAVFAELIGDDADLFMVAVFEAMRVGRTALAVAAAEALIEIFGSARFEEVVERFGGSSQLAQFIRNLCPLKEQGLALHLVVDSLYGEGTTQAIVVVGAPTFTLGPLTGGIAD